MHVIRIRKRVEELRKLLEPERETVNGMAQIPEVVLERMQKLALEIHESVTVTGEGLKVIQHVLNNL